MGYYILRRLFLAIPVLFIVSILAFLFIHVAPGDPIRIIMGETYDERYAEHLRVELHLDKPLPVQYLIWLGGILRGDLGKSYFLKLPISEILADRFPTTLVLAVFGLLVALLVGVPTGIISATRRNTWVDMIARVLAMIGVSMPIFWFGLLVLIWIALRVKFFPTGGSMAEYGYRAMILPCVTLGLSMAALVMRITRSSMLEELPLEYVRVARAKGLRERKVIYKHVLKNTLLPVITMTGLQLGYMLGGTVLTETVFNLPGIGRLFVDAIHSRDDPVVQTCLFLFAAIFVLANLATDMCYAFIDPRIRYG